MSSTRQDLGKRLKETQEEIDSTIEKMEHHRKALERVMAEKGNGAKDRAVSIHLEFLGAATALRALHNTMSDIRQQLRAIDKSYNGFGGIISPGAIVQAAAAAQTGGRGAIGATAAAQTGGMSSMWRRQ